MLGAVDWLLKSKTIAPKKFFCGPMGGTQGSGVLRANLNFIIGMRTFRNFIITLGLALSPWLAQAQDTQAQPAKTSGGMEYLFAKGGKLRLSGFGAPVAELSFINGQPVLSNGGGGALLVNQRFFIGAYSLSTITRIQDFVWENNQFFFGNNPVLVQVGGWLGYNFSPHRVLHLTASAKVGYAQMVDVNYQNQNWGRSSRYEGTLVVTPQLEAELNLLKWMKLNVGAGYRWAADNSLGGNTVGSPVVSGTLLFGWFK
jgi:hypothetical protein